MNHNYFNKCNYNELPEDGVTAPKHVVAILIETLLLFLRQSLVH